MFIGHSKRNKLILTIGECVKFENACRSIGWQGKHCYCLGGSLQWCQTSNPQQFQSDTKRYRWWNAIIGERRVKIHVIQQNVSSSLQYSRLHIVKRSSLVGYVNTTISYSLGGGRYDLGFPRSIILLRGVQHDNNRYWSKYSAVGDADAKKAPRVCWYRYGQQLPAVWDDESVIWAHYIENSV